MTSPARPQTRTSPKGRPTPARGDRRADVARANRRATVQWVAVFALAAALVTGFVMLDPSSDSQPGPTPVRVGGHGG